MPRGRARGGLAALGAALLLWTGTARAEERNVAKELDELRALVLQQAAALQAQQKRIDELERKLGAKLAGDVTGLRAELDKLAAQSPGTRSRDDLRAYWKDGLRFQSLDKQFSLKLGGRVMADWSWMSESLDIEDSFGRLEDGFEFRRLRLYGAGTVHGNIDYKLELDFADNEVTVQDAYLGFRDLVPAGVLTVGHVKEPFSLDELTSSKYITFMERSQVANAFAPSYGAGALLSNHHFDERLTWAAGVFRSVDDRGESHSDGGYNLTARVTGLPWCAREGERLLHLGVAASLRDPKPHGRTSEFEARPPLHLAPKLVSTGALPTDRATLLGLEAALVHGPFSLQAEGIQASVDPLEGSGDSTFRGAYLQASCFLTGEHRVYSAAEGRFGRVKPRSNYGKGGLGALEVAARYDLVDLDDRPILGGDLRAWTLGFNWYLNPNTRLMLNYADALLEHSGHVDLLGVRFQIDF